MHRPLETVDLRNAMVVQEQLPLTDRYQNSLLADCHRGEQNNEQNKVMADHEMISSCQGNSYVIHSALSIRIVKSARTSVPLKSS